MRNLMHRSKKVADDIEKVFGPRDQTLVLTEDNSVHGIEGIPGLHLIGACLRQAHEFNDDVNPSQAEPPEESKRLAKVKASLELLSKKRKPWWILCYHLHGTADWGMAYSQGLSLRDATQELTEYVQNGMWFSDD